MLEFPRFNEALHYTLEFYTIGRIKDFMFKFAGGLNYGYLDDWEDIILGLHTRMENEIQQTILTTTPNTQVYFFEVLLKGWLTDYRIASVNADAVYIEIDRYNEKTYQDFELRVEKKYEAFSSHPNFQRQHLEKYVEDMPVITVLGEFIRPFVKREKVNYKYYCIEERPELIDLAVFKQYIQLLSRIVNNFKRIVQQYVSLYDAGKIIPNATIIKEKEHIAAAAETKALSEGRIEPPKKLKMDLSVPQLAYLFKLLYDLKLIQTISKAELKRFILAHFSTVQAEDISDKSLENKLSSTEKAEADWWAIKFKEMLGLAKNV